MRFGGDLHLISRGRFGWRAPCHCLTFECVVIYREASIPAASIPPDVYIWDYWVVALLRTSYPPTYACSFRLVTESVSIVLMRPHFPRYVCAPHPESDDGISERKWRCAHIECSWVVYCSLLAIASAAAPLGTIKFHQAERRIFFVKVREREREKEAIEVDNNNERNTFLSKKGIKLWLDRHFNSLFSHAPLLHE